MPPSRSTSPGVNSQISTRRLSWSDSLPSPDREEYPRRPSTLRRTSSGMSSISINSDETPLSSPLDRVKSGISELFRRLALDVERNKDWKALAHRARIVKGDKDTNTGKRAYEIDIWGKSLCFPDINRLPDSETMESMNEQFRTVCKRVNERMNDELPKTVFKPKGELSEADTEFWNRLNSTLKEEIDTINKSGGTKIKSIYFSPKERKYSQTYPETLRSTNELANLPYENQTPKLKKFIADHNRHFTKLPNENTVPEVKGQAWPEEGSCESPTTERGLQFDIGQHPRNDNTDLIEDALVHTQGIRQTRVPQESYRPVRALARTSSGIDFDTERPSFWQRELCRSSIESCIQVAGDCCMYHASWMGHDNLHLL